MTESEWLKSKDGEAMLAAVADRLTPRKLGLLACGVVRRVLHLLPIQTFHEAVVCVERGYSLAAMDATPPWPRRLTDAGEAARAVARFRQHDAVKAFDPDADLTPLSDDDDDTGSPARRVFLTASRYAAESVAAAADAAGSAADGVANLCSTDAAARLAAVRQAVGTSQAASAEVSVLAMLAADLSRKAERLAQASPSRRRNLQFSIAANTVNEATDEADRKVGRAGQQKRDAENTAFAALLREQLGNPFRAYRCQQRWRTETVLALAAGIEAERTFDRLPILADALDDAGCDERGMLDHLRGPGPHAVGCWVLDLLLDREPELFALPPLVPTPPRMQLGRHTPPPEGMA